MNNTIRAYDQEFPQRVRDGLISASDLLQWNSGKIDKTYREIAASNRAAEFTIGWLGNMTLNPLQQHTDVFADALGIRLGSVVAPYGQYFQELLNELSATRSADPDVLVLALSLRRLAPSLVEGSRTRSRAVVEEEMDNIVAGIGDWVKLAKSNTRAHLFVCNFVRPPAMRFGIADMAFGAGEHYMYSELNRRLASLFADEPRVTVIDANHAVSRAGVYDNWNPQMYRLAKVKWGEMGLKHLSILLARACRALFHPARKCLIMDLDNTLWGGVLGEEGPEGIRVGEGDAVGESFAAFQRSLLDMKARGILLAVCSKNNPEDVQEAFRLRPDMPISLDDFACTAINWQPKHANIQSIADTLNIGVDSLAFVDDNPVECELIRQMLPDVLTIELPKDPAVYADLLYEVPQLDKIRVTEEDLAKTEQYKANFEREVHRQSVGDMETFLKSLETEVVVRPARQSDVHRIHQLFTKTNQFNVTTIRYTGTQIEEFLESADWLLWVVSARDKFGELGTVGLFLVELQGDQARIDSFIMSCRALGRSIETVVCNVLKERVFDDARVSRLVARFVPTAKNAPASDFFAHQGFDALRTDDDGTIEYGLERTDCQPVPCPAINVVTDGGASS